jgi:hypothetical protein
VAVAGILAGAAAPCTFTILAAMTRSDPSSPSTRRGARALRGLRWTLPAALLTVLALAGSAGLPLAAQAQESVAELTVLQGSATVFRGQREIEVRRGLVLRDTDRVRTGPASKARLRFYRPLAGSGAIVTAETEFEVRALSARQGHVLRLVWGAIRSRLVAFSRRATFLRTGTAVVGVKGTDFIAYVKRENATEFIGVEGLIEAASRSQPAYSIRIGQRQWGEIVEGEKPNPPIRVPDALWFPALREFSFPGEPVPAP